jgi:hypothetical protein
MGKQPPLPGSRAKDVMCKRWDTPQITVGIPIRVDVQVLHTGERLLTAETRPTIPVEAHICEYPIWAYRKQSTAITSLRIGYEDGSFVEIEAPKGFPSVTSPGYLDVLLYYGQRDLFRESYVEMSAYSILKHLGLDPRVGGNRERFIRDMERHFALRIKTDRFLNPVTRTRTHVAYFRVLNSMELAKRQEGVSRFYFNELFLGSIQNTCQNRSQATLGLKRTRKNNRFEMLNCRRENSVSRWINK